MFNFCPALDINRNDVQYFSTVDCGVIICHSSYYSETPVYSVRWYKNGKEFYRWLYSLLTHALELLDSIERQTLQKKYLNSEKPISIEERNHSPFSWQPLQSLCRILWHFYSAGHLSLPWNAPPPSPLQRPFSPPFPPFLLPCTLYSFRPGRERPISVHPVAGVTVEVEGSSIHQVTSRKTTTKTKKNNFQVKLSQLSLASTGRYRCEVNFGGKKTTWKKAPRSAKRDRSLQLTPSLATCWSSLCRDTVRASSAGRIGGSKYFPTWLELDASRYQVGENLRMNCTSGVRASYWNQGLDRIFQ